MNEIRVGAHTVSLSNQGKLLFPDAGLTKGDLVDYYTASPGGCCRT